MTRRFLTPGADIDSIIEPILVLSSKFLETEQESIPDYFWPVSGKWGIRGQFAPPYHESSLLLIEGRVQISTKRTSMMDTTTRAMAMRMRSTVSVRVLGRLWLLGRINVSL